MKDNLIKLALDEDLGIPWHDATTDLLFPSNQKKGIAKIISKHHEKIVICGIDFTRQLIQTFDSTCQLSTSFQDGEILPIGGVLLEISGSANTILKLERTILNFLRHLCAISTLTHHYVERVKGTALKILDTRKTTPGFRHLEKYAVKCGGGVNHRMGLYDAIMIKDTHVDMLGSMQKTLSLLTSKTSQSLPVIVEVRSWDELEQVMQYGIHKVDRVLLDNMSPTQIKDCVDQCKNVFETEASGNICLENILEIAQTGVQFASVGRLTYSAGHVDLSMQISTV